MIRTIANHCYQSGSPIWLKFAVRARVKLSEVVDQFQIVSPKRLANAATEVSLFAELSFVLQMDGVTASTGEAPLTHTSKAEFS
jgi:hypothetical protein